MKIFFFFFFFFISASDRKRTREVCSLYWCSMRSVLRRSDIFIIFSCTWATRQLMMCVVNTDFCIMPDKASIVARMLLFHLHFIPLVLKRCQCTLQCFTINMCSQAPMYILLAWFFFPAVPWKLYFLIKVSVINLLDVYIYCSSTAGMFPFPADIEAWKTV